MSGLLHPVYVCSFNVTYGNLLISNITRVETTMVDKIGRGYKFERNA